MGRTWVHVVLVSVSRFALDLRVGPRTLEMAQELVASVALACRDGAMPLFLVDDHVPYRAAILKVFGWIRHRRRRHRRGRRRQPDLKPPPGLRVGVVQKVRDAKGHLLRVRHRALYGRLRQIRQRLRQLGLGHEVNTSHIERLNGTMRGQQARLTRRSRSGSRREDCLAWALALWRDVYNWVRPHRSLGGRCPALALQLADHVWSIVEYVCHPVHVSDLQRDIWAEERKAVQESALDRHLRKKALPIS